MKKKALLTLASFGLLVIVMMYATIAWYTNIANVTDLTFDVADFDFKVNYEADDFILQLDDYLNVKDDKAAPGTGGVIPVEIAADGDVGATYAINIDLSNMAPEFKERIRFFYYTKEGSTYKEHLLDGTTEDIVGTVNSKGSIKEYIYWEWLYTADITPILVSPYIDGTLKWTNFGCMDDMTYLQIEQALRNWEALKENDGVKEKYAELKALKRFEKMDPLSSEDTKFQALVNAVNAGTLTGRALKEKIETEYLDAHDEFDTELAFGKYDAEFKSVNGITYEATTEAVKVEGIAGSEGITSENLKAYQVAMEATLLVSGAQAKPLRNNGTNTWSTQGTTAYVKAEDLK